MHTLFANADISGCCLRGILRHIPALLLVCAGPSYGALGEPPTQFAQETTVVGAIESAASSYVTRDTTLASGTHVREYVSSNGIVFAVAWDGPFLPNLRELLGKYFDTLAAESARQPRAGRPHLDVGLPEVVINSGGRMRAFEGSAWIPAQLPAGFAVDTMR